MYFYLSILTSMVRNVANSYDSRLSRNELLITNRVINTDDDLQHLREEIEHWNPSRLILRSCVFNVQSIEELFADLNITDIEMQSCDISRVMIFTNALRNVAFN